MPYCDNPPQQACREAQRVKLATELARRGTGKTLYLLDEPTIGLHIEDTRRLIPILHRLVDAGNTVIVIEHNTGVIKNADWIIDLGPEGGSAGGEILAEGVPEDMMQHRNHILVVFYEKNTHMIPALSRF